MCGRYTLSIPGEVLAKLFALAGVPELLPRYNIAPTQDVPIVRKDPASGARVLDMARWGLVPSGARDLKVGAKMINARQETLFEHPAFRSAARSRRCLVPADGFIEWREKLPFRIKLSDGRLFAMAGVYDHWRDVESFSVVTTDANEAVADIHDRMPVIIEEADFDLWLDPSVRDREALEHLLQPLASGKIVIEPVSTRVNDVANDDPECLAPRDPERKKQLGFDFG